MSALSGGKTAATRAAAWRCRGNAANLLRVRAAAMGPRHNAAKLRGVR